MLAGGRSSATTSTGRKAPIWSLNHLDRARDLRDITPSRVRACRELILGEMVRDFFGNDVDG